MSIDDDAQSIEDATADDDLFADGWRRANPTPLPKPLDELSEDEVTALNERHRKMIPRKRSTRRRLEGEATNKIRNHLFKHYGAVTTRVNSGSWKDDAGNTIAGAKAGTSDVLACVPIHITDDLVFGIFFAIEVKSIENNSDGTDPQKRFIARVRRAGGAGAVVRTVIDVDQAIAEQRQAMIDQLRAFIARLDQKA